MSKSIELADKARQMFREEEEEERKVKNSNDPRGTVGVRDVRISLSLGPFGATLSPAQEFDGFYPPPYGPKAFSDSIRNATENTEETNCNTFGDDREAENESIRELARFHYERLKMVFEDEAAWERIDCLAFETVPLTREIVAIRRAVGMLNERIADSDTRRHSSTRSRESDVTKPWWISMVFPDGVFPEMTSRDGSARVSVRDVVSAATTTPSLALPRPSGLGINCTQAEYLPNLVSQFDDGLRKTLSLSEGSPHEQYSPLLVLYPNGGDVYDIETQTWIKRPGESSEKQWAEALRASCAQVPPSQVWSGVIVGGCCRTTPMHIRSLKETVLSDESWHP
ncbi:hypothetical protein D9757_010154 [Collybiopsis confluens]|uniref:Hcy-binding domain-containing protein n=1 Tax=Collybiopsis confluens TaxID=2823264 RepID=A0A8H5H0W1_9AGAR|nr:hypothetical protein D9757_010154 [Collybiopsis confluens]